MCEIIITKPEGSTPRETIVSDAQVPHRDKLHPEKAEAHSGVCGDGRGPAWSPPGGRSILSQSYFRIAPYIVIKQRQTSSQFYCFKTLKTTSPFTVCIGCWAHLLAPHCWRTHCMKCNYHHSLREVFLNTIGTQLLRALVTNYHFLFIGLSPC